LTRRGVSVIGDAPQIVTRRDFLSQFGCKVAGAGLGISLSTCLLRGTATAANKVPPSERIRVGHIGVGSQGSKFLGAESVAVCDVDKSGLATAQAKVEKATGKTCAAYSDYRRLLDSKEVDAVVIATPEHWHALPTVAACAAGKDVYCEKPLTLTMAEGRVMVTAARKYQRIVQTGSQQRSSANFRLAFELVRSGPIGK